MWSWTTLNVHYESIEDELNIDGGKHVLAVFLNKELFWIDNKTIIEFGFRIMKNYGDLRRCSSISIILHKILSLIH